MANSYLFDGLLYHGTSERFPLSDLRPGGYDQLCWTTPHPAIAQTYIPTAGMKLYTFTDTLWKPSTDKTIINVQRQFKIFYDLSSFNFDGCSRIISYCPAPLFLAIANKKSHYSKKWFKIQDLAKKLKDVDGKKAYQLHKLAEEIWGYKEKTLGLYERNYINQQLLKLGYKPIQSMFDKNHQWELPINNGMVPRNGWRQPGRLIQLKPLRTLNIFNHTQNKDCCELDSPDYHNLELFAEITKKGFDGIKIHDLCQSNDMGNFGHISIGLTPKGLSACQLQEVSAVHRDLQPYYRDRSYHTPESLSFNSLHII